ncbi:MAG: hypothetical protein BWX50_01634 [Euryarchaeota archaeon ADurb.Bin009]|nr:MAG: hypothetical protein BWX50_01634 [Euryarchaeota archaeon ADurb.Bin009]
MQEHAEVPGIQAGVRVSGCDRAGETAGSGKDTGTLGTAEVVLHKGRELLVLLHAVETDLGRDVVDDLLGRLDLVARARVPPVDLVLVLDVVHTVVGVLIEDVVGVGRGRVLGESDTAGHVGAEPYLVEQHGSGADDLEGGPGGVVGVFPVRLDDIGEDTEHDAAGLVRATGTPGRQVGCHLDDARVLCRVGEVGNGRFAGAHAVGADEGHTDLHRRPPGGRSTVAGP